MKNLLVCFVVLFLVCVLMPLGAMADLVITSTYSPFPRSPGSSFSFSFYVSDDNGPVEGQAVTFSVSPDDGTVSLSPTSATTDSNGKVLTWLNTGSGSTGVYRVTATAGGTSAGGNVTIEAPPPPPELSISVKSGPGSGEPGDALTFTVEVQEDGSAASGKTVTFSITSGDGNASLNPTSATTGSNGQASTTLTLGNSASGSYTVKATVGSKFTSGTATVVTSSTPSVLSISVVSGPGSGKPGDALTFTVEVQEDGSAASGKSVAFSITSGDGNASLNSTSATTGSNGQASTTLTLGNSASGSYTVTATVGSKSTSGTATVDTPEVSIQVVSGPGSGKPGQGLFFVVEVQEDGSPASGKTVTFSVSPDDGAVSLDPTNLTTNSNGRARALLLLLSGASGSYTVTAAVGSKSTSGTATVGSSPPPPELSIGVVNGPGSGSPGDALTFTVEVQADGSPASGKTVTFSITTGDGNASLNPTSVTTGNNGQASTTLTLGNSASGSYTVTATVGSESTSGTATVAISPPPQQQQQKSSQQPQITSLTPTTITPPETTPPVLEPTSLESRSGDDQNGLTGAMLPNPFEVLIRDQNGNPLEGVTVTFDITSGVGSLSAATAVTDENGRAESTLTLGSVPGKISVKASVESISQTATFNAEANLPPPVPTVLSIDSGGNQEGMIGEALPKPFVVVVRDQYDAPMEGVEVNFAVSGGGGSLSDTSVHTNEDGLAQSTLTLGQNTGTNSVTVAVTGIGGQRTFTAEGIRIPLAFWIITGFDQKGVTDEALANPFVVEVRDRAGERLPGVQVTFTITGGDGTLSATSASTDSNGRVEVTLTLGPKPGRNTVEVAVTGIQETKTVSAFAEVAPIPQDVNRDNVVNILDLELVAAALGDKGQDLLADINGDGLVNLFDLMLVASALENTAAAPSAWYRDLEVAPTRAEVKQWLSQAQTLDLTDVTLQQGVLFLEQLLAALTPNETALLPNYPNPFNPETWIPYQLATSAEVTLHIYAVNGTLVRTLALGHQPAGMYQNRSRAAYWDGRNAFGEPVASGVYFYHLFARDYSATRMMLIVK